MHLLLPIHIGEIHKHLKDLRLIHNLCETRPHLLVVIVEFTHRHHTSANDPPYRSGQIAVEWYAVEQCFADDDAE